MHCPRCTNSRLVEISMTLAGERVLLRSCSACDTRWWNREGEPIALRDVLQLASVR
jgi:transposase-like protein